MTEQPSPSQETPTVSPSSKKSKKLRRLLKYTLGAVIVLLGASAGGAAWLLNTNSGLRFAVYQLPKLADIQITSQTLTAQKPAP